MSTIEQRLAALESRTADLLSRAETAERERDALRQRLEARMVADDPMNVLKGKQLARLVHRYSAIYGVRKGTDLAFEEMGVKFPRKRRTAA